MIYRHHPTTDRARRSASRLVRTLRRAALLFAAGMATGFTPAPAGAQGTERWDASRALELMERARERRLLPARDTSLRNYSAQAEGFVYFYLDRRDSDERTLVKTDQVALELYWAAPNRTSQRIVGLRDASRFPNRMHYHLDHLTVVQNGFGNVIRMGDGDEVSDVPHPAAPGADSIYEFRLADSLTIQLPAGEPIRVYELQVRPRRVDRPAIVGSVFVDRGTADIVRMTFTFTPVSYVDRRLDHISVSLDNGLWDGRYWLPNEQTLQIRRQLPELDFAASAVIQGRMRIRDYTFNDSLPPSTFLGYPVTAVPPAEREAYPFERGIYDDLNDEGLAPAADLGDVRRQAAELLGTRRLSGLPRLRLGFGSVSSALRYNRAEGVALGAGLSWDPGDAWRVDLTGGFAFGPDRPWSALTARRHAGDRSTAALQLLYRDRRDLGIVPGVAPALNTLAALVLGDDYLDPYYATGARLVFSRGFGRGLTGDLTLLGERHGNAERTVDAALFSDSARFRPVRAVDEGDLSAARVAVSRPLTDARADAWGATAGFELGTFSSHWYLRPTAGFEVRRAAADLSRDVLLRGSAGALLGTVPAQRLYVLGGTNTLPGYDYRSLAGTRYGLASVEASAAVLGPWLRLRLIGAAGVVGGLEPADPDTDAPPAVVTPVWQSWSTGATDGMRFSAGAGLGLFWDLLRVDWVHGFNGGDSRLLLSFHRDFWDIS